MPRRRKSDLFDLVKSLTKSEKRYFKLYATRQKKNASNKYVLLFNTLDEQEEYDEAGILAANISRDEKGLASLKKYLYDLILKALQDFHTVSSRSVRLEIKDKIARASFLFNKGLFKQCATLVAKAKKLALEHNELIQLLELYDLESMLATKKAGYSSQLNTTLEGLQELDHARMKTLDSLRTELHLHNLLAQLKLILYNADHSFTGDQIQRLDALMADKLLEDESNARTFLSKVYFYAIHALNYQTLNDLDKAHTYSGKLVDLYRNAPAKVRSGHGLINVIAAFGQHADNCLLLGHYEECKSLVEEARLLQPHTDHDKGLLFSCININLLNCWRELGQLQEFGEGLADIEAALERFGDKIHPGNQLVIAYNIVINLICMNRHAEALDWANKVLYNPSLQFHRDFDGLIRLIILVIHYELQNFDVLESLVPSTFRYFAQHRTDSKFEQSVLRFLRTLQQRTSHSSLMSGFMDLKRELEQHLRHEEYQRVLQYFDFIAWLESKISGRPFMEVFLEHAPLRNGLCHAAAAEL